MTAVFVHLSDIHFGQEKLGGQLVTNEDAREQLIGDAAKIVAGLSNGKAAGVILTGDIAYAGKRHEYDAAGTWLDNLTEHIGCTRSDIQMVPGNHDIDRDLIKGLTDLALNEIHAGGEEKLDSFLEEAVDREVLYLRFREYRRFAAAYQCPLDCTGANSTDRRVELAAGRAIRFVRLNSALICRKKKESEKGKLLLGARQRVMKEVLGEELIVLVHHPLDWYADSKETTKFLRSRARVFISGHEHLAALEVQNVEKGRDLMMLAAGATTPDEVAGPFTYSYNIIEFGWDSDADALAVKVHHRTWNDEMKRFESKQIQSKERNGIDILGSPNFREAPKPTLASGSPLAPQTSTVHVEIIVAPEDDVKDVLEVDESQFQNLYLRFFRDLPDSERFRILSELDAMPADLDGGMNHEIEGRLFRSVVRSKRFGELRDKVQIALDKRP